MSSLNLRPSFKYEKELWHRGLLVAGIDEVGRGALAGPLVAAAVILAPNILQSKSNWIKRVRDSKKLTPSARVELYQKIIKTAQTFAIAEISNKQIDRHGIQQSNVLVVNRAVSKLKLRPDYLLVDFIAGFKSKLPFTTIVRGDNKIFSVACASILAKVHSDNLMIRLNGIYTTYKFDQHKGYGTSVHRQIIKKHGLTPIHRKTFKFH